MFSFYHELIQLNITNSPPGALQSLQYTPSVVSNIEGMLNIIDLLPHTLS